MMLFIDINELTDVAGAATCRTDLSSIKGCDDDYQTSISRVVIDRIECTYLICNLFYWSFIFSRWNLKRKYAGSLKSNGKVIHTSCLVESFVFFAFGA